MSDWIQAGLRPPLEKYSRYLASRGVDSNSKVSFHSWNPVSSDCSRFNSMYGDSGYKIREHLVIPITSPRGSIIGLELRQVLPNGDKRVSQYRTLSAQWNPYFLGSPEAFSSLHEGGDLWITEGVFDKVALDRVIPTGDAVVCTLRAGMDQLSIDMIHRYYKRSSTLYICYDNDETGRKKSKWLNYEFEKRGMRSVIWKYRGKDPGEVFKEGGDSLLRRLF